MSDNPANTAAPPRIGGLFDEAQRSETRPARYLESHFPYLNSTARGDAGRVRSVLEEWYSVYPEDGNGDLRRRFRSSDDRQFAGAFFELYTHELLRRLSYRIAIHPAMANGRAPDFLCSKGRQKFYVEATVAIPEDRRSFGAQRRIARARDAIDSVESPDFLLWIEEHGEPARDISGSALRAQIRRHLESLDYDRCVAAVRATDEHASKIGEIPSGKFRFDGWTIVVRAIPVARERRGHPRQRSIAGWGPTEAHAVDNVTALRSAIQKKASHYGKLDAPFVVATNTVNQSVDHHEVLEALFGREIIVTSRAEPRGRMTRKGDGVWHGPHGPRAKRVSAVLVAVRLSPWSVSKTIVALYRNPWALHPLKNSLHELPGYHDVDSRMEPYAGLGPDEIFGLPESWPGADR